MRKMGLLLCFVLTAFKIGAQPLTDRLKVSTNGHYLQHTNGQAFFWLGDTGWELFHRLDAAEIKQYLDNRAAKGFNVIQAVALAEFNGLRKPNRYNQLPLVNENPATPNPAYFALIDSTVKWSQQRGLYLALLPAWGDKVTPHWGDGPVVFDSINAYTYGRWLGNRYKNNTNIIWILGGDRPAVKDSNDWRPIWRAMAKGILDGTANQCLIAYHPWGGSNSTSQWIHKESWLDVNMFQSGHGGGHDVPCWELVARDRQLTPAKPTLDAEPNYEDHPVNPWPKWNPDNGYYRDYDVRKQLYRSVFAGACGVTYGHHAVWQFMSAREEAVNYPDRGWMNAMDRPGAVQAGYLRRLMESHTQLNRIPDSSLLLTPNGRGGEHMEACRDEAGTYAMVYLPIGRKIAVNTQSIKSAQLSCAWFNPRTAQTQAAGTMPNTGTVTIEPPVTGVGYDWVLVIKQSR
ncbi:glycoside hydrolase family 140 protein [Deminuibacter soli]|uniref:DUF4038 domain-containing protein n=1 Tax=Deminuibacter soli TaxID=2291815 RepID=A0A3E1NEK0_9BACT|nr:glycoside hydrolase family 140 protein [Deminuibacter soli]RFM26409.1 DUF4038 domain-containing protein [Deminuibacter soli]